MLRDNKTNSVGPGDFTNVVTSSSVLTMEALTPLSQRVAQSQPELTTLLDKLKQLMETSDFERYIESLIKVQLNNQELWIITKKEMHRSLIERNFLPQIKEAFGVSYVRIISQP